MPDQSTTQTFNNLVALFLAEAIRSRRMSLARAAEISHRVVSHMDMLNSEDQALELLTNIEKDFEEVASLKQALHFGYRPSDVKIYETEIRDYASKIFAWDITLSNAFLQDAAKPGASIQELCLKYPEFCQYLCSFPDKAALLPQLQQV
jgi:hypothetical protein